MLSIAGRIRLFPTCNPYANPHYRIPACFSFSFCSIIGGQYHKTLLPKSWNNSWKPSYTVNPTYSPSSLYLSSSYPSLVGISHGAVGTLNPETQTLYTYNLSPKPYNLETDPPPGPQVSTALSVTGSVPLAVRLRNSRPRQL